MSRKKIKVAVLAERLGTSSGGTEVFERCTLNALYKESIKTSGIEIIPVLSHQKAMAPLDPGLKASCRVLNPQGKVGTFFKTWLEIKQIKPDVIHACFVLPPLFSKKTPIVATIHDIGFIRYKNHYPSRMAWGLKKAFLRSVNTATTIVTGSENTRLDILECTDAKPDQIKTIYYGLDTNFLKLNGSGDNQTILEQFGISTSYILYTGKLEPRKNVTVLIKAYDRLRKTNRFHGQLVLLGSRTTFLCEETQSHIDNSPFKQDIIQPGFVPDQDVPLFYTHADVLCFPSLYEGFGFPVVEAMACNTPVVCSNSTCLPEIVGDAGVLVAPDDDALIADALSDVIHDQGLRSQLISRGKERMKLFTWENAAKGLITLYRQLANDS